MIFCLYQKYTKMAKWPFQCIFGKDKKTILIFSTYPSILLYQSFGKWKRMSNLPPAIFIGPLNAEKQFFGSNSEKIIFPTNSHKAPFGLPVPSDGNKCCVCCLKKQHMLPKISDLVKNLLSSLQIFLWRPGTSWSLRNLIFFKKVFKKPGIQ